MDLDQVKKMTNMIRMHYGPENQIAKAVEELSELITELARTKTKPSKEVNEQIVNELADSMVVILQMWHQYGWDQCKYKMEGKLAKLVKNVHLSKMNKIADVDMGYDFIPCKLTSSPLSQYEDEDNIAHGE
jgi:hypothetical protein